MKSLNKLGIVILITFLLLLTIPSSVNAEDPDFTEDDTFVFGYQTYSRRTVETDIGNDGSYSLDQSNMNFEITDINTDDTLDYTSWDTRGEDVDGTMSFDKDNTEFFYLFRPFYTSDDGDPIITSIGDPFDAFQMMFIDPQWDDINDDLADNIDQWEWSYWDNDAYTTIDMQDFIDETDTFTLMGESDLDTALDKFTDTTHEWSGKIVFDTGGVFYWDWEDERYREYDHYEVTWEVKFTSGGTLSKAQTTRKHSVDGKWSYESGELMQNKALSLGTGGGGLLGGVTHAFEFPIMVLAVVSCIVAVRMVGNRKR